MSSEEENKLIVTGDVVSDVFISGRYSAKQPFF